MVEALAWIKEEVMDARTAVQQYLGGVEYPANKHQLAATAQDNDAPLNFIRILLGLSSASFSSPEDVVEELERLQEPPEHRPFGG